MTISKQINGAYQAKKLQQKGWVGGVCVCGLGGWVGGWVDKADKLRKANAKPPTNTTVHKHTFFSPFAAPLISIFPLFEPQFGPCNHSGVGGRCLRSILPPTCR